MSAPARFVFATKVAVRSPFLFASLETSAVGVDAQSLTDEAGRLILPADHLKGLLRHAFEVLQERSSSALAGVDVAKLLGEKSRAEADEKNPAAEGGEAFRPIPGELLFGDLCAETFTFDGATHLLAAWRSRKASERASTRIKIDGETGVVEDGMLQVVDLPAPLDALVCFEGEIVLHASADKAKCVGAALGKALRLIPYFGAMRSVGFGEHEAEHSSVGAPQIGKAKRASLAPMARFYLDGRFDRPFVIDAERLGDNLFVGRSVTPGAVVKGALAEALKRRGLDASEGTLGAALTALRIGHGFPVDPDSGVLCDRALPLAAKALGEKLEARREGSEDGLIDSRCADFPLDWKPKAFDELRAQLGRPESRIAKLPRGHTAIDNATGSAMNNMLFVEAARGLRWGGSTPTYALRFVFDFFDAPPNSREVEQILDALADGLDGIGKTRARLDFDHQIAAAAPTANVGDRFTLMLETPAALVDLDSAEAPRDKANRPASAFEQLERYFALLLPGAKLVDVYLQARRVGGYPAQRRRGRSGAYRPYTIFEPGSCFVFEAPRNVSFNDEVRAQLRRGLPATHWTAGARLEIVDDWRRFPWLPAAGYGEFSVAASALDFAPGGPR